MKEIINIANLKFATINNKYGVNKHTGELYLTQEYKDFKNIILLKAKRGYIKSPYKIRIEAEIYQDYDNILKPIADALQAAGVIDNDKNIVEAHIIKTPVKKGQLGSLKVYLETIP
jgi:Holliday junction resolvase RusA-like endonuclease